MFSSSMIMKTIKRNKVNTFRRHHRDHDATTSTTTSSVTTDDEMSLTSTNDIDIDINNDDALMTTLPWKPSNSKKYYITPTCYKLPKGNEIETMPSNSIFSFN